MKREYLKINWNLRVLFIILAACLAPLLLSFLGISFGSASQGGAGAHFAGWANENSVTRIDINALGLVLLVGVFTTFFFRLRFSPFVTLLGVTLVLAGMSQSHS